MSRCLIVFFSQGGTTKRVAQAVSKGRLFRVDRRECGHCSRCMKSCPTRNISEDRGQARVGPRMRPVLRVRGELPEGSDLLAGDVVDVLAVHGLQHPERGAGARRGIRRSITCGWSTGTGGRPWCHLESGEGRPYGSSCGPTTEELQ